MGDDATALRHHLLIEEWRAELLCQADEGYQEGGRGGVVISGFDAKCPKCNHTGAGVTMRYVFLRAGAALGENETTPFMKAITSYDPAKQFVVMFLVVAEGENIVEYAYTLDKIGESD